VSRCVGAGRSVPNFILVFPGVFVGPVRRTAIRDTKSVPAQRLIGGGVLVSVAATALIWWQPDTVVSVAGFVLLGAALAGMFPALIAVTTQRIGEQRAQHAIAWQVGAAAGGGSAISALVGLLINTSGLDVVGPALVVLALLLLAANTALTRLAPIPTERVSRGSARR
jgi:fucose permease